MWLSTLKHLCGHAFAKLRHKPPPPVYESEEFPPLATDLMCPEYVLDEDHEPAPFVPGTRLYVHRLVIDGTLKLCEFYGSLTEHHTQVFFPCYCCTVIVTSYQFDNLSASAKAITGRFIDARDQPTRVFVVEDKNTSPKVFKNTLKQELHYWG